MPGVYSERLGMTTRQLRFAQSAPHSHSLFWALRSVVAMLVDRIPIAPLCVSNGLSLASRFFEDLYEFFRGVSKGLPAVPGHCDLEVHLPALVQYRNRFERIALIRDGVGSNCDPKPQFRSAQHRFREITFRD
jgi:hypothetical protein